jgi:biopolymer transport protein ExbB
MTPRTVFIALLGGMIAAWLIAASVQAQDDPFDLDEPDTVEARPDAELDRPATGPGDIAADRRAGSFAEAFFIARKTVPGSAERRVELLGSAIIWFLLLLSMLSIGLIGYVAMRNRRREILPDESIEHLKRALSREQYSDAIRLAGDDSSDFGRIMHSALREASHGFGAMMFGLQQASEELATERLRRIELLNVLGQVSPMIGLFGTVYGMILAFRSIVAAGGNADPVLLAGGIGTALTTTFWGLVVAIPALAGDAIVRNKIESLSAEATLTAVELINEFRPRRAHGAGGEGAAAPGGASGGQGKSGPRHA